MKKLFVILALASPAQAQLVNFDQLFHGVRAGVFVDQHFNDLAGVYTTVLEFHNAQGQSYVDLNIGYLKQIDSSKGSPLFEVGLRVDNLLAKVFSSQWALDHATLSELPSLEFGPFVAVSSRRVDSALKLDFLYGVGLAVGF